MSREYYTSRFSDSFANRAQGSTARADMIARAQEASVPLTTPADISPVNTGHSEKGRVVKILGPLAVPFLIAACSASSQPQARQIESSPTVPISTPTVLPTREATATSTPIPVVCDRQAPKIPSLGGEETKMTAEEIAELMKARAIREKQEEEERTGKKLLTCEDVEFAEAFKKKYPDVAVVIPTSEPPAKTEPTATATVAPKPSPTVTPAILETATPEAKYRFTTYGVYMGEAEGGGIVLFSTLPDGTLFFESLKQQPRCSIPDYYMFFFDTSAKYQPDGKFAFKYSMAMEVTGELVDENTVVGKMLEKGHIAGSPKGQFTCEKTEVGFKANLVGTGRTALLEAKRNASVAAGFPKPTVERALMQLEAGCKCKLPE